LHWNTWIQHLYASVMYRQTSNRGLINMRAPTIELYQAHTHVSSVVRCRLAKRLVRTRLALHAQRWLIENRVECKGTGLVRAQLRPSSLQYDTPRWATTCRFACHRARYVIIRILWCRYWPTLLSLLPFLDPPFSFSLTPSELSVLREIVHSSADANDGASFLAVFKAYDAVLKTHSIDPSTDRIYFKSLLKLARVDGETWVEKFNYLLNVWLQ